jgi:hypothetical protein
VLTLGAFASPSFAQQKIFSLTMSYPSPTNAGYYRATFKNETPQGNSTINSIYLYFPSGATVVDWKLQSQQVNTSVVQSGNRLAISNMPGIPSKGGTWWVDVKLSGAPACSLWNAGAFAGNAFSQPFELLTSLSVLYAGTGASCAVKVDLAPPSVTQNGTSVAMTATFTTPAPTFGAVKLAVPAGLTLKGAPTGTTGTVSWTASSMTVTNISPAITPATPLVLSFTVDVAPYCSPGPALAWTPTVYAGTAASGATLSIDGASALSTQVSAALCSVSLTGVPTTASANNPLPTITVNVLGGSGSGNITMTSNCSLGGTTTGTFTGGTGTISGLKFTQEGSCNLTATATGPEYSSVSGGVSITVSNITVYPFGELGCGDELALLATNPGALPDTSPGWAGGYRGLVNSKGDTCIKVNYEVDNTILVDNQFELVWDTSTQKNATFLLTANSKSEEVDATGWPTTARPSMAWKYNGATPVPIDGIACVAPTAPSTYATAVSVDTTPSGSDTIVVNTTPVSPATYAAVPPVPFVVSVNGKVLTVTGVSGSTWTVTENGIAASDAGAFIVGKFPLLPEIYATVQSASGTQITVTSRLRDFPPAPFPITVSADGGVTAERMLVTAVDAAQQALTVQRGNGVTTIIPDASLAGKKIVSNPLPLIPAGAIPSGSASYYTAGTQAQMCVVSYGWSSIGLNAAGTTPRIMWTIEWLDIGDGWISVR